VPTIEVVHEHEVVEPEESEDDKLAAELADAFKPKKKVIHIIEETNGDGVPR
jgi:hypothetical protein